MRACVCGGVCVFGGFDDALCVHKEHITTYISFEKKTMGRAESVTKSFNLSKKMYLKCI